MTNLDRLIAELCPDGVEFVPIGDIYEFRYGKGNTIPKIGGDYPVYGSNGIVGTHNEYNSEDAPVIGHIGAYAGIVNWGHGKHFVTYNGVICKIKNDKVNYKYAYYLLLTQDFRSKSKNSSQPFVSYDVLQSPLVPLPPLPIQREIVRILDNFTELAAELSARQKQYNYYRDELLTFGDDMPTVSLGEVCLRTSNIRWNDTEDDYYYIDLTSVSRETNEIKPELMVNSENAPSRAQQIVRAGDALFATTRPTLQRYCYVPEEYDGQICSTGFCILRANEQSILPKFLFYSITTSNFNMFVENNQEGTSYPAISDTKVKRYKFRLPPFKEQERIVSILDRFDTLSTDISSGLPAEIAARQKQYEYYRDMLLSFKVKPA